MLESALEQLLLRFLAPYVDGISGDKLRVGVFRGSLELHALSVKAEAPSLLGLEGLRVRTGGIGRIQLKIPWNKLHTGKLRAVVEKVHLELEPIAEALARNSRDGNLEAKLMQELREAKSRAVEMRVEQMRDLIKQQSEDRLEGGNNYFVRLLRKILNNIHVDLSDLCIAFVTTTPGLALGLELSSLEVVSTDQTFRECLEEVNVSGQSLYKLLHLKGLALLVSPHQPSLLGAGYALSPSSVRLKLSHVPSDQTLRLQFEVATQEVTKVNFQRSQVMQILALRSAAAEEVARLYRLMVPLEQENEILQDVAGASEEYAKLFEEVVLKSKNTPEPPGDLKEDSQKLQQLEDTLSVRLLARQRLLVYNKLDQLRDLARRRQPEVEVNAPSLVPAISDQELQDMLREQDSKAEAVDLPQRLQFDLRLGKVSVNLVDDQSSDQALQQLLCWELHEANCVVHIHFVTDHRLGRDAAEWRVEGKFADMQATHCGETILCFRSIGHCKDAVHVVLANRLEPTRNLLMLNFDFAPLEVFLAVGLVPSILRFFQRDAVALTNASPVLEDEEPQETGALTQDVVEKVYAQIPDFLTVDLRIASPVFIVPAGEGAARFGLGHLHLTSTEPCTYQRMDFDLDLKDTSLRAVSARGAQFHVVNPLHLHARIQLQLLPDETLVDIKGHVSQVSLCLAPQALQILLGCRSALTSLCPEDSNAPGRGATVSSLQHLQPQLQVIANAMARTAASTRPIRVLLRSNLDGFEVTASDGGASVLRAQMVLGKPAVQAHVQSSPALFSLDADLRSLELDLLNSQSAWEPCLEPFSGMLQVERTNDGSNRTQQLKLIGRSPLLVNITPSMVHRTAWLWDAFSRATDVPAGAGGRRPSNGGSAGVRVINICEFPMELGGLNVQGNVTSQLMVQPTGSLWEPLDDVLPNSVTAVRVRVPQGDWSEDLSLDCAGDVLVPGACAAAEVLPDSSRLIFLAPTLRLYNRTRFTLLLRFLDGSQKEVLMLHVPATALCDASLLGPAWPMAEETTEACDMESHSSLVGEDAYGGLLALPPNSVGAVPMASFQGRRGSGRSALAWLTVQPMSNPSKPPSAPFQVGARVRPQLAACSGLNLAIEPTSQATAQGLSTTICFRPPLVFINALPIGVLTIRFTAFDNGSGSEWQEVSLGRLTRLGAYAASYLVEEGLQMQLRLDQGPWSDTWHHGQGNASSLLQLRQREDGAAADVAVEVCGWEVRVSSPCCFMDRSGLCNPLSMDVMNGGRPLPQENGVSLLSAHGFQEHCELLLRSEDCDVALIGLPSPTSWASFFWDTPCGYFALCLQVSEVDDGLDGRCQVITLRPRLVLTNASATDLELSLQEGRLLRLASGQSIEAHWRPTGDVESGSGATLRFRPLPSEGSLGPWSGLVPCSDSWAGTFAVAIWEAASSAVPDVWTVDIAPDCGALAVSLTQGSQFVARNSTASVLSLHPGGCRHGIVVPVGVDVPYGWPGPLSSPEPGATSTSFDVDVVLKGSRWRIRDVRHSQEVHAAGGITISIFRTEAQTVLQVSDCGGESKSQSEAVWTQKVEVKLSRVGLSFILAEPMVELFYAQLEVIRLELRQGSAEAQQLRLSVAAAQVDCQLSNRVDARNGFGRSLPARSVLPAMIFANRGDGGRAFLSLYIQRASTSQDWVIPHAEIALDAADLMVDDGWLDPLADFFSQARLSASPGQSSISPAEGVCSALGSTLRLAGRPIVEEYVAPKCPRIVQLDALHVSSIRLVVWCSMRLQNARFLPSYVRAAIRVISLSGRFTLDGATLTLPRRSLPVSYRGSLHDLARSLAAEYTVNLLRNVGTVLGKSSVLKLPRAPLKLAGTAMSLVTDGVGLAAGEAATLLNELTFDEEFVARQRQQQGIKQIRGIGDGMVEAGKSIAQGVEGLLDVVKKPVQGARSSGIGGFFAGVGLGVAGSLVKPVSRLGQAISDVGMGLAAEVSPDSSGRRCKARRRPPRLIYSTVAAAGLGGKPPPQIRLWSKVEAEVLHQLGVERLRGLQEVVPLMQHNSKVTVLLLFATHCAVAEIDTEQGRHAAPQRRQSHRSYNFSDLKAVLADHVLQLVDENGSLAIEISQQYQAVLEAVREELIETFQKAQAERSWAKVSLQLIEAKRRQRRLQDLRDGTSQADEGCGQRRLSVFEVERRMPGTSEWKTPFLPTDDDLSWRWVELQGRRHPYLPLGMTRSQAAASQLPPCRLGTLFHAASDWEVHHSAGRDLEGWSYGIAWQSSVWEVVPGPLDTLRRRLWIRTFT